MKKREENGEKDPCNYKIFPLSNSHARDVRFNFPVEIGFRNLIFFITHSPLAHRFCFLSFLGRVFMTSYTMAPQLCTEGCRKVNRVKFKIRFSRDFRRIISFSLYETTTEATCFYYILTLVIIVTRYHFEWMKLLLLLTILVRWLLLSEFGKVLKTFQLFLRCFGTF